MYSCGECGKECVYCNGTVERTCNHNGPIIANMSATAVSVSGMNNNGLIAKIVKLLQGMLK